MEIVSEPDIRFVYAIRLAFDSEMAITVPQKKLVHTCGPSNRSCVHWDQAMETWKKYDTSSFLQNNSYFFST